MNATIGGAVLSTLRAGGDEVPHFTLGYMCDNPRMWLMLSAVLDAIVEWFVRILKGDDGH